MKALVLSSGGIDSTTALAIAVSKYGHDNVISLSVSYGQKHTKELEAAASVAAHYNVENLTIDVGKIFEFSDSSLLQHSNVSIPHESYAQQTGRTLNDKPVSTYVPFRNGIFLSIATGMAISKDCSVIYYGIHSDDAAGFAYPDCSDIFNESMAIAIREGSGRQVTLEAPFVKMTKSEVVRLGVELSAPYHLTWSCYEGGDRPCGACATCIDRKRAFELNGLSDPALSYT